MNPPISFLAIWPGSFLYHLITLLVLEAGLGIAWDSYRRTKQTQERAAAFCFGGILLGVLLQALLFLLIASPLGLVLGHFPAGWLVEHLISFSTALLILWAFVLPNTSSWKRYFLSGNALASLGLVFILIAWFLSTPTAMPSTGLTAIWQLWQILLYALAIGLVLYRWRRRTAILLIVALAVLLGGHLLRAVSLDVAVGLGWERLGKLVGYIVLWVAAQQHVVEQLSIKQTLAEINTTSDTEFHQKVIQAYKDELQTMSQEVVSRQAELVFLLETSQAVNSSLELQSVLQQTAQHIALAVQADVAVIALREVDDPGTLRIVTGYDPRSKEVWELSQIRLTIERYPVLKQVVICGSEPLIIQNSEPSAELLTLHAALGSADIGPLLMQAFCHRDEALGVLMLGNARSQKTFSYSDGWLCQTMADQVSGAIANARLYDEVTSLLEQRQTEVSQRQAILDSVTDGVIVADKENKILMVNPAATEILKQSEQKMLGRFLIEMCPELANQEYPVFEAGPLMIAAYRLPVYLPDKSLLGEVAVLRDVTRERKAELAKSRFIETVSHELRTPITSIKGYTDLLLGGAVQPGSDHFLRFINTIKTNTERLNVIVNNMIAVSEMDGKRSLMLQSINIPGVLEDVLKSVKPELEQRDLQLAKHIANDLPSLLGDPLRLRQVFDNLLSNAVKYTYPGGKISVITSIISPEESEGAGFIKISIVDTGVGIPPDEQTHIFDKFYRAENPLQVEAGGPGVGLTVAKDIIEQHGGYIWMNSAVSQGSKFHVVLPIAGPQKTNKQPNVEPALGLM